MTNHISLRSGGCSAWQRSRGGVRLWGLIMALSAFSGCATMGAVPSGQRSDSSSFNAPSSPFPAPSLFPSSSETSTGPRLILPASGGPPVMAIPLGGNVYLPLNADPVTTGIPLSP